MLQLLNIRKSYTTADFTQVALDDISISFRDNEFVAILGPSGSGKTTLLNIVGGLDHYDSGNLIIDGIATEQYKDRDWDTYRNNRIGFVFQSYNLIPHQTVLANVELALTLSGVSRSERRERAKKALEEVGLGDHINKKPSQLSGGQMQRVAIARALINDPEILLADEPTGALDSKTSVQIMALLTEIAKDRLVIMVTHNPELADAYATRIVNLHDGRIDQDSNPFDPSEEDMHVSEKPVRKTAMSFFTAISLSFNNLMTKKGRTIMTAFAGSIGIIGIAAILSLANGVNNYIKSIEEETLSVYPLTIESTGIDMTSMLVMGSGSSDDGGDADADDTQPGADEADGSADDGQVHESKMLSNMFSRIGSNDLASLKEFLDSGDSGIEPYVNSIEYSYDITPQIYSSDTANGVRQVNPDTSFSALGLGSGTSTNSLMSMSMSTNMFYEMVSDTTLVEPQYDIVAGTWPEKYDECLLVLNSRGGVSDFLLYTMGLRDHAELDSMVRQLANNEDVTAPEDELDFTYDELMGVEFKLIKSTDYYRYDETYHVWTDMSEDSEYMKGVVDAGQDLRITGIVIAKPDATATTLSAGIYYTPDLTRYLMDEGEKSQIVKEQLAKPDTNVFTGKTFAQEADEASESDFDMASLITVDEEAIANAFTFDESALNIDLSSLSDLSGVMSALPAIAPPDLSSLGSSLNIDVPEDQVNALMSQVMLGYLAYCQANGFVTPQEMAENFPAYLQSAEVQAQIAAALGGMVDAQAIQAQLEAALQSYMETTMTTYTTAVMGAIQNQLSWSMQSAMSQLAANMSSAMGIDEEAFMNAFQFNMDEKELSQLMMTIMSGSRETSYDNNLKKLGYATLDKPSGIDIYAKDFESKESVIGILDGYNDRMKAETEDDKVVAYTDIVGTLMSSVTDIINMISYVLVAFVAISLVVSSVMIGVITYISVLERKKEIGILRSIGASKKDIRNVFNAETVIVGFVAGALGIIVTALAIIPANAIVYANFDVPNVAILPWNAAAILILISVVLTVLAGLIPSSAASRKDPVEALRSE